MGFFNNFIPKLRVREAVGMRTKLKQTRCFAVSINKYNIAWGFLL